MAQSLFSFKPSAGKWMYMPPLALLVYGLGMPVTAWLTHAAYAGSSLAYMALMVGAIALFLTALYFYGIANRKDKLEIRSPAFFNALLLAGALGANILVFFLS